MPSDKTMKEVWRWKEEVARETKGMTPEELMAYYRKAEERLAKKTGKKLDLRHVTRRHK
jgi:hypothetical protein